MNSRAVVEAQLVEKAEAREYFTSDGKRGGRGWTGGCGGGGKE